MDTKKPLSEKESLELITAMIQQARAGYFHDSGIGAILWGCVISFAGFMVFFDDYFEWNTGFDWWLLALFALIPQAYIVYKGKKDQVVKTDIGRTLDIVWIVFSISIFAVIFYINIVPEVAMRFMEEGGNTLMQKNIETGALEPYQFLAPPSPGSLLLLLYAFPTLVTGVSKKFNPMIIGALITYILFIASLYTRSNIDNLFMGFAGLVNWLIPGLILRKQYLKAAKL